MIPIDYSNPAAAAEAILDWIETRLDPAHVAAVEERRIRALHWQPVDHPPVTISAPAPEPFRIYPYPEAFADPAKMLVNELVGSGMVWGSGSPSIVNSVVLQDDFPLQIRANYGIGIIASLFGAEIQVVADNMPWVQPIGPARLEQALAHGAPDLDRGLLPRALETMAFYQEALAPYPKCRQAIRITQTDLQGPFDIAAQLWGGEILTAFQDRPELLRDLLELLGRTYAEVCREIAAASTARVGEECIALHFTVCRGNCLLKDDSSIMLSPRTYASFIRPANERVLEALGGGGIHWCGSGQHWRPEFVDTSGLRCIDWGNPEVLDLPAWEVHLRQRRLPVAQMQWEAEQFLARRPDRLFPTGAAFTVSVRDLAEGRSLLDTLAEGENAGSVR
jgi:hypothetical protein